MTRAITLGLLTPFTAGEYLGVLVAQLYRSARARQVRMLAIRTGGIGRFDLPVAWNHVDGWIVLVNPFAPNYLERLLELGKPIATIAHQFEEPRVLSIESDNEGAVSHAVGELIKAGHQHIAFVGFLSVYDVSRRHAGYRRALLDHGLPYRPEYVIDTQDYWQAGGARAFDSILAQKLPVTALVAGTDHNAAGALTAAVKAGLRVPQDVAIIGYDNTLMAQSCEPALASIDQNLDDLADRAVSAVVSQIQSGICRGGRELVTNVFVPRESCGLPARTESIGARHEALPPITDQYELGRLVVNGTPESIQAMLQLLSPDVQWSCVAQCDDALGEPHVVTIRELYDYNRDANQVLEIRCELRAFPPLERLGSVATFDAEHFLFVLPVLNGNKLLRLVSVQGTIAESRYLTAISNYLDLLAPAHEHAALDEELARRSKALTDTTGELRVAEKRAQVADLARTTLLASMSHELRTPLTAILGYAQLLRKDGGLTPFQKSAVETVERSGQHLLRLIDDVLDLGRFTLTPHSVNLSAFVRAVADVGRIMADQKDLIFRKNVSPRLPEAVEVDEKRLRQVLMHLFSNAVKFTGRGEVNFSVRVTYRSEVHARVRFEVQDSGIGISQAQLETIFRPFEQVSDFWHSSGGMGLGLPISRELVRAMGGEICVESKPGEGSLFWFELDLPLADAAYMAPTDANIGYDVEEPEQLAEKAATPLLYPPPEEMEVLHEFAVMGSMRDIQQRAANLCTLDERYRPFAERLQRLAQSYQSKAILEFIRSCEYQA